MMEPKEFTIKTNVSPFATAEITTRQYKPWLNDDDAKNVLFASVHLFDNYEQLGKRSSFYPGTGAAEENTSPEDDDVYPGGILNVPIYPG